MEILAGNVGVFLETQYCHFIVSHRLKGFILICCLARCIENHSYKQEHNFWNSHSLFWWLGLCSFRSLLSLPLDRLQLSTKWKCMGTHDTWQLWVDHEMHMSAKQKHHAPTISTSPKQMEAHETRRCQPSKIHPGVLLWNGIAWGLSKMTTSRRPGKKIHLKQMSMLQL